MAGGRELERARKAMARCIAEAHVVEEMGADERA